MEKCGRIGQTTDNIILRMPIACWISKAIKNTLRIFNTYSSFYDNTGYANTTQRYVYTDIVLLDVLEALPLDAND